VLFKQDSIGGSEMKTSIDIKISITVLKLIINTIIIVVVTLLALGQMNIGPFKCKCPEVEQVK
jgi:hypothetical protein